MMLAGSFQITFYAIFVLFSFILIFNKQFKNNFFLIILLFAGEIFISILISGIQILPIFELMKLSTRRAGMGEMILDNLPFHPRNLITFISPYAFGDPGIGTYPHFGGSWGMFWENTAYIGIIPLLLAIYSLKLIKKDKIIKCLWILVLFTILLALGKYSPLFWVYYMPIFNSFRVTSRFLLFALMFLSILSGFGFRLILEEKRQTKYIKLFFSLLIITISVIDLFIFGYKYNPTTSLANIIKPPKNYEFLKTNMESARILSFGAAMKYDQINKNGWRDNTKTIIEHKNALDPNINMLWGIKNTEGYTGLVLERDTILREIYNSGISISNVIFIFDDKSIKLLGLLAVKYVISPYRIENPNLSKVYSEDPYLIYENKFYIPRGILVDEYYIGSPNQIFNNLYNFSFNPRKIVFIENNPTEFPKKQI